jgi:hypothetical protein
MYPNPMMGSFSMVPDKDNKPLDKLELKGSLDLTEISLHWNYFGGKGSFKGGFNDKRIGGEAVWSNDQKLSLILEFPVFELHQAVLKVELALPIDGFRNLAGRWEHSFSNGQWTSSLNGNLEAKLLSGKFDGSLNETDIIINTFMDITEYPRFEGNVVISNDEGRKKFHAGLKNGIEETLLNAEYRDTLSLSVVELNSKGTFLPEVTLSKIRFLIKLCMCTISYHSDVLHTVNTTIT